MDNAYTSKFHVDGYYSNEIYFRFYIPELFKQYNRVLYLDSDMIVDADISELLTIDFENHAAIAVQDTKHCNMLKSGGESWYTLKYFNNDLKLTNPEKYFNSGMILFNIKKLNDENIYQKLFETLSEIKKPKLYDQDILNSVLLRWGGGVKLISPKYNYMPSTKYTPHYITYKDIFIFRIKSILNLISKENKPYYIYHFIEAAKPWKSYRTDNLLFYKYLFSIHVVKPPKEFIKQILEENNRKFPIHWKLFMKFLS